MPSVAILVSVHADASVLRLFFSGLRGLYGEDLDLSYILYDDTRSQESRILLQAFCQDDPFRRCVIPQLNGLGASDYRRSTTTHHWTPASLQRIAQIKNRLLMECFQREHDAAVLVDDDVIVHPLLVRHLSALQKPIVSEVFWTRFQPYQPWLPNVWDTGVYSFCSAESILQLRQPGVYKVGGLGACTFVDRSVWEKRVDFSFVHNVDLWGEDRHFCIRAACADIELHADTQYPPYHVYRPHDLGNAGEWFRHGCQREEIISRLDHRWEKEVETFLSERKSLWARGVKRAGNAIKTWQFYYDLRRQRFRPNR